MSKAQKWFSIWPAILAAIALAFAWNTIRATPAAARQIRRKAVDLSELLALKQASAADHEAMRLLEQAGDPPALKNLLPEGAASATPRKEEELGDGWTVLSEDVTFNDADFSTVSAFLAAAEDVRPPWRAASCAFTASAQPGRGRVALVMESLRRSR